MRRSASHPFRILLTGFEPFGGSRINPSQEVVRAIEMARRDDAAGFELHTRILPVEAKRGPATLLAAVKETQPFAVLCLGESGRASAITIERVFVNLAEYRIADNAGVMLRNQAIAPRGPAAYFSTLPMEAMAQAAGESDVPVEFSLSAGAFLCNHIAYALLHALEQRRRRAGSRRVVPAGFVHLPRLPEQVRGEIGKPSMKLEKMVQGVSAMVNTLAKPPAARKK